MSRLDVRVRVPSQLRGLVGHSSTVTLDVGDDACGSVTVAAVLDAIAAEHPALERRVRDERGETRIHVNLFVGDDNVRDLDGLATPIPPGAELSIIPAISGG
jgi:sulfur-carrier protein